MTNKVANIQNDGLAMIIFPIMMSPGMRIEEHTIKLLFELLMLLTVCYPTASNLYGQKMPKIVVVFNNFGSK